MQCLLATLASFCLRPLCVLPNAALFRGRGKAVASPDSLQEGTAALLARDLEGVGHFVGPCIKPFDMAMLQLALKQYMVVRLSNWSGQRA